MLNNLKLTYKTWVYLGLIVSLLLRLFNLNYEGLWNDELFTAHSANPFRPVSFTIDSLKNDVHPPLHNILSRFWVMKFGYNDISFRILNIIIGSLGVLSVYHVSKSLFSKKIAIIAMWLATVNPFLIEYSQEVRAYGLLFLLANYSYYFFIKLYKEPKQKNYLFLYAITTGAALYTHYFALYILFSQLVILLFLVNYKTLLKFWVWYIIMFALPILLFAPWVPYLIQHSKRLFEWIKPPSLEMVYTFPKEFFKDPFLGSAVILMISVFLVYSLLRIFFKIQFFERIVKKYQSQLILISLWIILYFSIPYIRSSMSSSNMNDRYFIALICPMLMFLAFSISLVKINRVQNNIIIGLLFYSTITLFLNEQPYYDHKHTYRDIVEDTNEIEANTPILYLTKKPRNFHYYLRQYKFRQITGKQVDFDKIIEQKSPDEYAIFIDLQFKLKDIDVILKEERIKYEGYELINIKQTKNKYNVVTTMMYYYRKKSKLYGVYSKIN